MFQWIFVGESNHFSKKLVDRDQTNINCGEAVARLNSNSNNSQKSQIFRTNL